MIPVAVVDQMKKKNRCPASAAVDPPVAFRVLPPPSPAPLQSSHLVVYATCTEINFL